MQLVPLRPPARPGTNPTAVLDLMSARVGVSARLTPEKPLLQDGSEGAREDTSAKTLTVERSRSFAFAVDLW